MCIGCLRKKGTNDLHFAKSLIDRFFQSIPDTEPQTLEITIRRLSDDKYWNFSTNDWDLSSEPSGENIPETDPGIYEKTLTGGFSFEDGPYRIHLTGTGKLNPDYSFDESALTIPVMADIKQIDTETGPAVRLKDTVKTGTVGTVGAGTHTSTFIVATSLTGYATDVWKNKTLNVVDGTAKGAGAVITDYNTVTGAFTLSSEYPLYSIPSNGDKIVIG